MYVNEKMIPVKAIPEKWEGGIKENDEGDEFNYDIFHIF
jgi:hypothetical protein